MPPEHAVRADVDNRHIERGKTETEFSNAKIEEPASSSLRTQAMSNLTPKTILYMQQTRGNQYVLRSMERHNMLHGQAPFRQNAARGVIQRRRIPDDAQLSAEIPTAPTGLIEVRPGVARMLSRAWGEMNPANKATVQTAATAQGITFTNEELFRVALNAATRAQLLSIATSIRTADPTTTLGDPALIDLGLRAASNDTTNIQKLVTNANAIFTQLISGSQDVSLGQIFGTTNISTAKAKYKNAQLRMSTLHSTNHIVTDRSGYNAEVSLGGLTDVNQISVELSVIDNPDVGGFIVTFIHESMHAGNADVTDLGYINQPSFTALPEVTKLTNAAHFEVVPNRILGVAPTFAGQTFIPAGATVGGVTAPALTSRQQAVRDASETFRAAWTAGLNLHPFFVRVFRTPTEWDTLDLAANFGASAGAHFSNTLPFWSNLLGLTIHSRSGSINPAGSAAQKPVTEVDIALSEGVTRKMAQAMDQVPQTEADARTFEIAHASATDIAAGTSSMNAERDFLIKLVIQVFLGSITGNLSRDIRVVNRLAQADRVGTLAEYLTVRPATF